MCLVEIDIKETKEWAEKWPIPLFWLGDMRVFGGENGGFGM